MLRTRNLKIFRDITARKLRTAMVTLSVFVGVLGVVAMTTMGQLVSNQLEKDLIPDEMAMMHLFVEAPRGARIDNNSVLQLLRLQPGVTAVEGQAVYEFKWRMPGEETVQTGQIYASSEPLGEIALEPLRLRKGRYPVEGQGEIAIEQRMADRFKLDIGDTLIALRNGFGEYEMRIVGITFQPYVYVGGDDGSSSVYATYADAQHILGFSGFSSIYARFDTYATARQQSSSFRKTVTEGTSYNIVFYLLSDPEDNVLLVAVQQFSRVLVILAVVAMIVSSFLVTNMISTMVSEQRKQIGAMKALGGTQTDILRIYLGMAFLYGLMGSVPGTILGVILGRQAALAAAPLANTILESTSPPPLALGLGVVLGLVVPVLAAIVPVYHASRISILEAMTDQGIEATYGRGPLPYLVRVSRLPLPTVQALNNIFRHKARLALTVLTLTLAVAAFMGMFAVFNMLNDVIGYVEHKLDQPVSFNPGNIEVIDLMQSLLTEEPIQEIRPGVAVELTAEVAPPVEELVDAGPLSDAPPEESGEAAQADSGDTTAQLYVTGIDTTSDLLDLTLAEGTGWTGDPTRPGIVITPKMAGQFEKTVGDTLRLVSPVGAEEVEIIGISDFPIETAFMEWSQLAAFVGDLGDSPVPNAYWERIRVDIEGQEDHPYEEGGVWTIGIDERFGRFLFSKFQPETPGVIISRAVADAGGFTKGGEITLQTNGGSLLDTLLEDQTQTYPILEIVDVDAQELRLVARQVPPDLLEQDQPAVIAMYWYELASFTQLDYTEIKPRTIYIDLANPAINSSFAAPEPVFRNQEEFTNRVTQILLSVGVVMGAASTLMALVGGIGLLTIASIGVFERQREIGVMRSIGASSGAILIQFWLEGILVGLAAWLAGLPLSYLLGKILIASVPFSGVIAFRYTLRAPVVGLIGMVLITTSATLYPSIIAARKTVARILRYQ